MYLQCDWGVYPLGYFFTKGVGVRDAGGDSSDRIQKRLSEIIRGEDRLHPLSDQKLADLLTAEGMPIARRTVAKYREGMQIADCPGKKGVPRRAGGGITAGRQMRQRIGKARRDGGSSGPFYPAGTESAIPSARRRAACACGKRRRGAGRRENGGDNGFPERQDTSGPHPRLPKPTRPPAVSAGRACL